MSVEIVCGSPHMLVYCPPVVALLCPDPPLLQDVPIICIFLSSLSSRTKIRRPLSSVLFSSRIARIEAWGLSYSTMPQPFDLPWPDHTSRHVSHLQDTVFLARTFQAGCEHS